jgi:hypothetical protein
MEKNKISVLEEEIVVEMKQRNTVWEYIALIFIFLGIMGLIGIMGEYSHIFRDNLAGFTGFLMGLFYLSRLGIMASESSIAIDRKYLIYRKRRFIYTRNYVYRMEDIRNLSTDPDYRITAWKRILSLFRRSTCENIIFNHGTDKYPARIGYGLTAEESLYLLEEIRKKGWISSYQTSFENIEYKGNQKIKTAGIIYFWIMFLIITAPQFIIRKEFFTEHIGQSFFLWCMLFILPLIIFAVIMSSKNRKDEKQLSAG